MVCGRRTKLTRIYIYIFMHEKLIVDGWFYTRTSIECACRHAKFDVTLHRLSFYVYALGDTRIVCYCQLS